MADASFLKALKKRNKGGALKRARKTVARRFFDIPGSYVTRYSECKMSETDEGDPVFVFNFVIVEGDHEGKTIGKYHKIAEQGKKTEEMSWEMLCQDLQRLGYETDTDDFDENEILAIIKELENDKPHVRISVKQKGKYTNIDITEVIEDYVSDGSDDDDDSSEDDDSSDDDADSSDEDDDDSETSDDDSSDDDDDEEEPSLPSKGDTVQYTPKAGSALKPCKVLKVYKSRETCDLRRIADKKEFKDVPWEKVS